MSKVIIFDDIDISPLLKAQARFESFRQQLTTDQEKAGAIQAFEYCYELCWRFIKRVLNKKGLEVVSPRDAFRLGAQAKLVAAPERWFDFQMKRNLTSHTYNDHTMEEVVAVLPIFSKEMEALIETLKKIV